MKYSARSASAFRCCLFRCLRPPPFPSPQRPPSELLPSVSSSDSAASALFATLPPTFSNGASTLTLPSLDELAVDRSRLSPLFLRRWSSAVAAVGRIAAHLSALCSSTSEVSRRLRFFLLALGGPASSPSSPPRSSAASRLRFRPSTLGPLPLCLEPSSSSAPSSRLCFFFLLALGGALCSSSLGRLPSSLHSSSSRSRLRFFFLLTLGAALRSPYRLSSSLHSSDALRSFFFFFFSPGCRSGPSSPPP